MKLPLVLGLAATERLAVILAVLLLPQLGPAAGEYPVPERTYDVGIHTLQFDYTDPEGVSKTFDAAVWYPTSDEVFEYTYSNGPKSYLAEDGAVAETGGPFPLIIFNHGFNASEMQSLYLKEALAAEGYIVASVHFDDNIWSGFFDLLKLGNLQNSNGVDDYVHQVYEKYFNTYRFPIAEALLEYMVQENGREASLFAGSIDTGAIAMGGHSFGGLTTLGLIGGSNDPSRLDSRIKAALMLSAPSYPFEDNYGNVHIPIMSMKGELDVLLNRPEDNFWYLNDGVNPPYYDLVVKNADHFTFSETDSGLGWVPAAIDEDSQLQVIITYSLAFFDLYLKDDTAAATILAQTSPTLASYISETGP
ncbi:MAG: dienelactone hydrolase [Dehalogenimonas sp.]|uniref:Dienelactone hydrolase n=1 Tax=Candidatus Dehalogenimonas loeffleri TaxID=3127115 RepID=A0ABZ2J1N1_9CHLR|nr:dienelactone hydrolase [Dehalogenimonas sp.]